VLRFAFAVALALGAGVLALTVNSVVAVTIATVVYFAVLLTTKAIPSELIDALPWRR
jgi:hypothetical protein